MDNQAMETKKVAEIEINNVIDGNFSLSKMPVDYQLTVHINNLLSTYGKKIIQEFKAALYEQDNPEIYHSIIIIRIINHYGIDKVKAWFTLIYGWNFTQKAG